MAVCDDRQLTEAQRVAGYQNQRTGVQQAVRPFTGRPTVENLIDYINRELQPAVRRTRDAVNDVYLQVADNAPSGNPLGYYFSTETGAADPTAGRIRLNAATQDTATVIRVSESNGRLADVSPWLDVMSGSVTSPLGVVTLTDAVNPSRFIRFDLTAMSDAGAYWNLTVSPIESSHDNPFVDGGAVVLSFIPGVGGGTAATIPPTAISGADGPRQFLSTATGTTVDWRTSSSNFPGAPVYDVMAYPFNATGDGVADDTAAINAAIAAANVTSGYIYLGRRHKISAALTPFARDAIGLIGRGCRGDGTLITATGATPYNIITIDTVKDCVIRDLFIEGPGTWASRGLGIFIDNAFRTRVERVEIQDTYGAIEIYASVITEIVDTYAAAILGPYGFYSYGSLADGENHALRFIGCATGTDVTSGAITWYKQGSGSHTFELINCGSLHGGKGLHVCDDTPYGSDSTPRFTRTLNFQCEDAEIYAIHLEAGATATFTHTLILSCLGNAFQVDSTYGGNWEVNGGMIHGADGHGMSITGDHWCVVGMQIGNIAAGQDCINVGSGSGDFRIVGCSLGDIYTRNAASRYGINLDASCVRYVISDCLIIGNDTGAINDLPGAATSRVIQGCNPTSVNTVRIDEIEPMAVGTTVGRRVDAGSTGRPVALTGAEQAENWRRATIQTVSSVSGTLDILLNDDTTVLLIRTTADATLRTLGDGLASAGREVVIEHDRLSGSGNLTIAHNTAGTYSNFFNPDTTDIVLGQTTCCTVRLRSGFWRPQGSAQARLRAADYGDITVSAGGATWTIDNDVVSDAKLRNSAALSVIGRSANSTGDPADIAAANDAEVLRRSGTTLGFGTVATAGIANSAVTLAKMENRAQATFIGRQSGAGTGAPQELTSTQAATILALSFTAVLAVHYSETADASISITPPAGATWFEIECQGAGGGGGGVDAEGTKESCAAAGGSSGAWLRHRLAITTGNITGAIGAGGAGGSNTGGNGGDGTATSFTYDGATFSASGGNGGSGNTTGVDLNPGLRGRLANSAGASTIGSHEIADGQRGQPGIEFSASAADANAAIGGHGGNSRCGVGGAGSIANADGVTGGSGETGRGPGAGGGGAARTSTGAASTGATGGSGRDGSMRVVFYSGPVPTFASIS